MNSTFKLFGATLFVFICVGSFSLGAVFFGSTSDDDKVVLKSIPKKVRLGILHALQEKCDKFQIEEMETEVENGTTVYEFEIEIGELEVELEISADGKLLEYEVDADDEDDDNDDDEDDDNEDDEDGDGGKVDDK